MNILILHSEDGQDYVHAILYPDTWTSGEANAKAIEAFTAVQQAFPETWSWEDFEPALLHVGFTLANWHHGPTWDRVRIPT